MLDESLKVCPTLAILVNSVQEIGGNCRRSALAGGKRVIDDFNRQTSKW